MFSVRGYVIFKILLFLTNDFSSLLLVNALNGVIWSRNISAFVKIFSIQSFAKLNNDDTSITRAIETHDFKGERLIFTGFPIENLLNFDSDGINVSGVHGEMWQLLARISNFKITFIQIKEHEFGVRKPNGSWTGNIGYMYRNESDIMPRTVAYPARLAVLDFTLGTWTTSYRFYVKRTLQYQHAWMVEIFNSQLWFAVILCSIVLSITSFLVEVVCFWEKRNVKDSATLKDHFFYVYSTVCNQGGWIPELIQKRSKTLTLSTRLFGWILLIAFSSKLISLIAQRKFRPLFSNLETLYNNTDFKLVIKKDSYISSLFESKPELIHAQFVKSGRVLSLDDDEIWKKTCNGKYVYFEVQDIVEASTAPCVLIRVGKPLYPTWIVGGVRRGFKYRRSIDLGILRLHEFGFINRLKSIWLRKKSTMTSRNKMGSIQFRHVSLLFSMLAVAVILSLLILLFEIVTHFKGRRKV